MKQFHYNPPHDPPRVLSLSDVSKMITTLLEEHRAKLLSELTKWDRTATEKHADADMALFIWASEDAAVGQQVNWRLGSLTRLADLNIIH